MSTKSRIATVEQQGRYTRFWLCRLEGPRTAVYLLPEEFDYSPIETGDTVELTYQVAPSGQPVNPCRNAKSLISLEILGHVSH